MLCRSKHKHVSSCGHLITGCTFTSVQAAQTVCSEESPELEIPWVLWKSRFKAEENLAVYYVLSLVGAWTNMKQDIWYWFYTCRKQSIVPVIIMKSLDFPALWAWCFLPDIHLQGCCITLHSAAFSCTKEPSECLLKTLLQGSVTARTCVYFVSFSISSSHLNILSSKIKDR